MDCFMATLGRKGAAITIPIAKVPVDDGNDIENQEEVFKLVRSLLRRYQKSFKFRRVLTRLPEKRTMTDICLQLFS